MLPVRGERVCGGGLGARLEDKGEVGEMIRGKVRQVFLNDGHVGPWKVMIGWVVRLPEMTPLAMVK